jgi:hypothetical protein
MATHCWEDGGAIDSCTGYSLQFVFNDSLEKREKLIQVRFLLIYFADTILIMCLVPLVHKYRTYQVPNRASVSYRSIKILPVKLH